MDPVEYCEQITETTITGDRCVVWSTTGWRCPWCDEEITLHQFRGAFILRCECCNAMWERAFEKEPWDLIQLGGGRVRLLMGRDE